MKIDYNAEIVSVIMPTYNRAGYIEGAVKSVIEQTYPHIELIIIDDGSTDETKDVVSPFLKDKRIRYIVQENAGAAAARNRGLALRKGKLIAFIDSDDFWEKNKLEIQLSVMRMLPSIGLVCSDFSSLTNDGRLEESHIKSYFSVFNDYRLSYEDVFINILDKNVQGLANNEKVYWGNIYETMIFGNLVLTSTTLCRESVFEAVGTFDTKYETLEDYDLFLKIARQFPVAFINKPLSRYRYSNNQLSGELFFEKLCRNLEDIFLKNVESIEDRDFIRKYERRIRIHLGRIQANQAYFYFSHGNMNQARSYYWRSLQNDPVYLKHYVYFLSSLLSPQLIRLLRKLKASVL